MFDSVQPHRRQPTRLPRPWDSPGKNTRVGCHFNLSQHQSFPMSPLFASSGQSIEPSASILSMKYSGLISFWIDLFDLLAIQGTLKSLLQQHNSKTSILGCSAFFMVQIPNSYMTTRKTIYGPLTIWTFRDNVP